MSPLSIVLNVSRLFSRHVCQIYTSAGYMGNSVCFDVTAANMQSRQDVQFEKRIIFSLIQVMHTQN